MPRLAPLLLRHAFQKSSLLPLLLRGCRSLQTAEHELKWIKQELPQNQWLGACIERSKCVPLQYILGSQPFGDLDIICENNVLIPRWETEEWTIKLANVLRDHTEPKILDICSGTGCIALSLGNSLSRAKVTGMDISTKAIEVSNKNKSKHRVNNVEFELVDLFEGPRTERDFDLITSNPPYIYLNDYLSSGIQKSVRLYEPRLALVGGLEFYKALIENIVIPTKAKGFIFELGYENQFLFTKELLGSNEWDCELYFDSAKKPRCVVGWKRGSEFSVLKKLL